MTMNTSVIAVEISARDAGIDGDGLEITASANMEPAAMQPISPPAATITQP
jgi:hypothetical protein